MLKLSTITKSFSGVEVLHNVSIEFDEGCVTALVGENGAGKSTLMKILSGVHTDYKGDILSNGSKLYFKNPREAEQAGISIIHQELSCIPDLTVAENIFIGKEPVRKFGFVNFSKLFKDAESILKGFDFPYPSNIKVKNISVGWQQIVEIAHAFTSDAKIFILDEPTSALTESEIKILFHKIRLLKQNGKIIIFISHRLEEIYEIADDIIVLRDGQFIGKYSSKEIARTDLINKMVGKKLSGIKSVERSEHTDTILKLQNLSVFDKKKSYLSNISFELMKGEILGLAGLMGSGKTELLKFLFGEFKAKHGGKIYWKDNVYFPKSATYSLANKIFYLSKDRKSEGIFSGLDIIRNSSISVLSNYSSAGFLHERQESSAVAKQTTSLNVRLKSLFQPIKTLSGGNQQKVLLGRGLMLEPELLLLDEPTRGIDVGAKEEIYNLITGLSKKGISFLISSSEIPELLRICDRILVLFNGKPTALLNSQDTNAKEILHYAFSEG